MNTDPHAVRAPITIRAEVDAVLAELPQIDPESADAGEALDIDAMGRRLEEAHQILVDALESVEKG